MIASTIGEIHFKSRQDWNSFGELIGKAPGLKIPRKAKRTILQKLDQEISHTADTLYPEPAIQAEPEHYIFNGIISAVSAFVWGPNLENLAYQENLMTLKEKIESLSES